MLFKLARSRGTNDTLPPVFALTSFIAASARAGFRHSNITLDPSALSLIAASLPSPELAPVMSDVRPASDTSASSNKRFPAFNDAETNPRGSCGMRKLAMILNNVAMTNRRRKTIAMTAARKKKKLTKKKKKKRWFSEPS